MKHIIFLSLLAALPAMAQNSSAQSVPNPAGNGSLQPSWSALPGGTLLSWIEKSNGGFNLKYAIRKGDAWSEVRTVATGRHFFRHPAEVPEIIQLPDGTFIAHWIENGAKEDSDAEFAYVSASKDGVKWSAPVMAHKDHSDVQHGLASIIASGDHEASLIWLEALHGEDAPVAMKRSIVSAAGALLREEVLDPDVCGCCPTSIANTSKGLLIAYRAHTKADIRDIATTRLENGKWSPSKVINADGWKIDACPTNAASISAKGDRVVVSWYTGANDNPRTQIAISSDSGTTFGKPILVSTGHSFGYTSAVLEDDGGVVVSWLEQGPSDTRILARRVTATGALGPVIQIASGSKQSLGYPKLIHSGADTWIAWASAGADGKVQTARVTK